MKRLTLFVLLSLCAVTLACAGREPSRRATGIITVRDALDWTADVAPFPRAIWLRKDASVIARATGDRLGYISLPYASQLDLPYLLLVEAKGYCVTGSLYEQPVDSAYTFFPTHVRVDRRPPPTGDENSEAITVKVLDEERCGLDRRVVWLSREGVELESVSLDARGTAVVRRPMPEERPMFLLVMPRKETLLGCQITGVGYETAISGEISIPIRMPWIT